MLWTLLLLLCVLTNKDADKQMSKLTCLFVQRGLQANTARAHHEVFYSFSTWLRCRLLWSVGQLADRQSHRVPVVVSDHLQDTERSIKSKI